MAPSEAKLSAIDDSGMEQYRPISRLSVLALLLALATPLALLGQVLWLVPMVAILIAIIALRQLAANPSLVGRNLVLSSLAVAIFFGATAMTRAVLRTWLLYHQARPVSLAWLELVRQGQWEQAHQCTMPLRQRQPSGTSLASFYENTEEAKERLDSFFEQPALASFIRVARKGQMRFVSMDDYVQDRDIDYLTTRFVAVTTEPDQGGGVRILVHTKRVVDARTRKVHWEISGVSDPEEVSRQR